MASPTDNKAEPFPALSPIESVPTDLTQPPPRSNTQASDPPRETAGPFTTTNSPSSTRRRTSSIRQTFLQSNPPLGAWQAAGEVSSKVPSLAEIRNGSFSTDGWNHEGQLEKRGANPHDIHRRRVARTSSASIRTRASSNAPTTPVSPTIEERQSEDHGETRQYFPRRASLATRDAVVEEGDGKPEKARARVAFVSDGSGDPIEEDGSVEAEPGLASHPIPMAVHASGTKTPAPTYTSSKAPTYHSNAEKAEKRTPPKVTTQHASTVPPPLAKGPDESGTYPNGYRFPAEHTWGQAFSIAGKAFLRFVITPFGFAITVYSLNVIGWGAMIFFLIIPGATPAMCNPSCDDKHTSARQIWIENTSQILNALFCVTGFGLFPWRARDFYYLMKWQVFHKHDGHRRLAGIYRGWYRLPGSDSLPEDAAPPPIYTKKKPQPPDGPPPYTESEIEEMESNPAIPLPATSMPDPPLTGIRAPPTKPWKVAFVIWMYLWNTIFQVFLATFMWAYNRFNRPTFPVGLFITLGCLSGIAAGVVTFKEGKKVKSIEGIPIQEYDVLESVEQYHERKEKESKELEKKESRHSRRVERTEKIKGHQWFTRH